MSPHDLQRFWSKVATSEGCWNWTAGKDRDRYGRFWYAGGKVMAHRFSYELAFGPIPAGLHILHQCDNPSCVNPAHLRSGTHQDNMRERSERGRVHVRRGEQHHKAKLTLAKVVDIRRRFNGREATVQELANEYGVSHATISDVTRGITWKDVPAA